ncbi:hypothetical protein ABBQ32_009863 [Trebouxia sp. C0010 RCD-2024]
MYLVGDNIVGASQLEDRFDTHVPEGARLHMPQHLSRLRSLTHLIFITATYGWQSCYQICMLTNLQKLALIVAGNYNIGHAFEALVQLKHLFLGAGRQGCLELSLEWRALQVLTSFSIISSFTCNANILELLELQHFQCFHFTSAPIADSLSNALLETLINRLLAAGKIVDIAS